MAAFESFYPLVLPFAPGASGPAIDSALRQAAIEFCKKTWVWQELSSRGTITAGKNAYDIQVPLGAVPVKVLKLTVDGQPVDPKTADDLDMMYAKWTEETAQQPRYFTQLNSAQFILVPMPNETRQSVLAYRAAYRPSEAADSLPDLLYNDHARAIADGALAILMDEADTPYFNPERAVTRMVLFENAIQDTKLHVQKSFARAPTRTRASYF